MPCLKCGYSATYSSASCPICNDRAKQLAHNQANLKQSADAGREFGDGLMAMLVGLFAHPFFSLVTFTFFGYVGMLLLAPLFGLSAPIDNPYADPARTLDIVTESAPGWYHVPAVAVPAVVAVVFRKPVRLLMKALIVLAAVALLVTVVVYFVIQLQSR
ncbi:MAG: hypothetical protein R3F41_12620 [Gammaproteobacteria bacterium]|nr:hypothetical protein [Pseudomonadales bacterium]MCP5348941.1 hypothetical protein [Pseudomonadales bacterium]